MSTSIAEGRACMMPIRGVGRAVAQSRGHAVAQSRIRAVGRACGHTGIREITSSAVWNSVLIALCPERISKTESMNGGDSQACGPFRVPEPLRFCADPDRMTTADA